MKSLRGRLFAATLGALAVTLALTVGIGAVLTRRQVDRSQAAALARRADDTRVSSAGIGSYVNENVLTGRSRTIVAPRADLRHTCPTSNADSDGTTSYDGRRVLYSYRTLPSRGLLLLRPRERVSAAWHPFLATCCSRARRRDACGVALVRCSRARSCGRSDASRRRPRRSPPTTAPTPLPEDGPRRAASRSRRRSTRWPSSSRPRARASATSCSRSATS